MKNETNTQHTPAPWKIRKAAENDLNRLNSTCAFIDADGQNLAVARILQNESSRTIAEAEANAQLIARAPELLKENEQLKIKIENATNNWQKEVFDNSRLKDRIDSLNDYHTDELRSLQALNAELLEALKEIAKMDNKDFANSFHPAGKAAEQIQFIGKMAKAAIAKAEGKTLVGS